MKDSNKIINYLTRITFSLMIICCIALGINNVNVTQEVGTKSIEVTNNIKTIDKSIESKETEKQILAKFDSLNNSLLEMSTLANRSTQNAYHLFKLAILFGMLTIVFKLIDIKQSNSQLN